MPTRIGCCTLVCWLVAHSGIPAADNPSTPADITVLYNLRYREGPSKSWALDLAMKKARGGKPRPGIVIVHGGGLVAGDKIDCSTRRHGPCNILDFAELGFVAASINYRLTGEAPLPAAVEDCKCAVRWLRAHAKEYHLDPHHIGAVGPSAGGYLVLMLGLAGKDSGLEGDGPHQEQSSRVQAVASESGSVNGGRKLSPTHWISKEAPPLLLIYGGQDSLPLETADQFVAALDRAGLKDVSYYRLAHASHCPYANKEIPYLQTAVSDFFVRTLMDAETAKEVKRRVNPR